MNFYERHIGDYLKDTAHLSLLEHGVYTRLLDIYYTREGGIPEKEVARLVGARSKEEREALASILGEFFTLADGIYTQGRAEEEIERLRDKRRKASASASARWGADRSHSERNANASPTHMRTDIERNANALPTQSEGNARAPVPSPQSPVPSPQGKDPPTSLGPPAAAADDSKPLTAKDLEAEGIAPQVASDWLKVRRAKKAPLTRTAWAGVKREAAAAGLSPGDAVKLAAEAGWQGFKAAWLTKPPLRQQHEDPFEAAR